MHERTLYLGCDSIEHRPGDKCVLESWFEGTPYGIIFEDDGDTGYFYAAHEAQGIFDALHIYNVHDIADRDIPSTISLLWDETFDLAALEINGYGGAPMKSIQTTRLKSPFWSGHATHCMDFMGKGFMPSLTSSPARATAATPFPQPGATGCANRTACSMTPCSPAC